jgi:hypothetical protein
MRVPGGVEQRREPARLERGAALDDTSALLSVTMKLGFASTKWGPRPRAQRRDLDGVAARRGDRAEVGVVATTCSRSAACAGPAE